MDALTVLLLVIGCLIAGAVAGWAFALARAGERSARERAAYSERAAAAEAEAATLRAELEHQRHLARETVAAARADDAAREERERREQSVLRALAPVQESLDAMQRKVVDLERDRHHQYGALAEQLRAQRDAGDALRATTESLAGALRSGATRGVWGETQLRRVVEAAGLTRYVDFDLQTSITSDAGAGRPDMIIRLPGDKALAVDAKAPLDAYLEASAIPVTAQGAELQRRRELLARHVKAVRGHIDALARKTYWLGLSSSPEFVICFIPSESLLAAALEEDPSLLDYAFSKRVALASPVNLWAVLKTVAYTWTQQDVSAQARELFDLGTELYRRLGSLAGHADKMRRAIERTVDAYNGFIGSLESRVLTTARRFPGIDEASINALAQPAPIDRLPRRVTAPELLDGVDDEAQPAVLAEVGELRERLSDDLDASSDAGSTAAGAADDGGSVPAGHEIQQQYSAD
jgi:DNA recombination protein RmuC